MADALTGGCLCGAIRYSIDASVNDLRACHCRNCQKASGAAGTVGAVVPTEKFKITKGATKIYKDSATDSGRVLSRHFCANCGSPLYSQRNPDPGFIVVRAGTLDNAADMKIVTHIWTSSAWPWHHIDPGTETHPGNMPPPKTR